MAYSFNGSSNYMQSASSVAFNAACTDVSLWFWVDPATLSDTIVFEYFNGSNFNALWTLGVKSGGNDLLYLRHNGGGGNDAYTYPFGVSPNPLYSIWHHLIVNHIWNAAAGGEITAYLDGSFITLTNTAGANSLSPFNDTAPVTLGRRISGSLYFTGRIAEVAMYAGAASLTSGNVAALWNGGSGEVATNVSGGSLKNYWPLCNNGVATTGGIDLNITGATQVAGHPVVAASCADPVTGTPDPLMAASVM